MAAMCSVAHTWTADVGDTLAGQGDLAGFRRGFYTSLTARADALFELTEAVLCADGPVTSLVELTLVAEHRRGHGAMYDALAAGRVEPARLRRALTALPLPRATDGRIVLATAWRSRPAGTGSTPGSPTAPAGSTTPASYRSSRAP